jgi:hypothetical protein
MSTPVILSTGASRWSKASSFTMALISAPTPACGHPSSTTTTRLVLRALAAMASRSSGLSEPKVDHLRVNALLRKLLRRFDAETDHLGKRHERHVCTGAHNKRFADGRDVINAQRFFRNREGLAV